jgi:membrane protease YdiL (CAAX protease family)
LQPGQRFCVKCGTPVLEQQAHEMMYDKRPQQMMFAVYGVTLVLIMFSYFLNDGSAEGSFTFDLLFIGVTVTFAILTWKDFKKTILDFSIRWWWPPAILALAVVMAIVVHYLAGYINESGGFSSPPYLYYDTDYPYLYAILSIAVVPGIFEELMFRGVFISQLKKMMNTVSSIWVSAIVFAILHLSPVALIWLLPAGLITGWMRFKTGQLWPGMLFHFAYNFSVVTLAAHLDNHYF